MSILMMLKCSGAAQLYNPTERVLTPIVTGRGPPCSSFVLLRKKSPNHILKDNHNQTTPPSPLRNPCPERQQKRDSNRRNYTTHMDGWMDE